MLSPVLLIVIFVILLALSFIFKKVFKWFFYVSLITTLLLGLMAYFVFMDVSNLKKFPDKTSLLLLDDSGEITLAGTENINQKSIKPLSEEETSSVNSKYQAKDYESIRGQNFLVLIFSKDYLFQSNQAAFDDANQDADERFQVFVSSIASAFSPEGKEPSISSIVSAFKEGHIKVYPETITFKLIKIIPTEPVLNLLG